MLPNEIEALNTLRGLNEFFKNIRAKNPNISLELPIFEQGYKLIYEGKPLLDAVSEVINRPSQGDIRNVAMIHT